MRPFFVVPFLALLCGCNGTKPGEQQQETNTTPSQNDFLIIPGQRVGAITSASTELELKQTFGEGNITIRSIHLTEGETKEGVVVFPDLPDEVEIVFDMATATGKPALVRFIKPGGHWKTADGISVGASLDMVTKANGGPFFINGFEWDLGGQVIDWNDGKLSDNLLIAFRPDEAITLDPSLLGEGVELSSDDPALKKLNLKVSTILVLFD